MLVHHPIKISAIDQEDLQILSAHLQDAILPLSAITYDPDKGTFSTLVHRFCWEHPAIEHAGQPLYQRVHCGLHFEHVNKVMHRGFAPHKDQRLFNLLCIGYKKLNSMSCIHLFFSGESEIRIDVQKILCHLGDIHDPWPTYHRPKHIHEHLEEYTHSI
jgi:hypothetical protein